jgi:hypothetical protein
LVTLKDLLVPTYVQMLQALAAWLRKAQAQKPGAEAEALLSARLAPDMFPLATQIRFACVQAQEGLHRLNGSAFPATLQELLDEGRNAGERPGSIAGALARIEETVALVQSLASRPDASDEQRPIAHALPAGMIFDLTAAQFARDWAVPQFYFHVMTAYAILRHQGINLGKADYVAHMLGYLRGDAARSEGDDSR